MWLTGTSLLLTQDVGLICPSKFKSVGMLENPPYPDPSPLDKEVIVLWLREGEVC